MIHHLLHYKTLLSPHMFKSYAGSLLGIQETTMAVKGRRKDEKSIVFLMSVES